MSRKKTHMKKGCEKSKLKGAKIAKDLQIIDCQRCILIMEKKFDENKAKSDVDQVESGIEALSPDNKMVPIEKCTKAQLIEIVKASHEEITKMNQSFENQENVHDELIDGKVKMIQEKHHKIQDLKGLIFWKNVIIFILFVIVIGLLMY